VRVAVGACSRNILTLILREGMILAAAGVVAGTALAYGVGRAMQALLAGVSPNDLPTFSVAVAIVLITALGGSLLPAVRAIRLDPMTAIRAN